MKTRLLLCFLTICFYAVFSQNNIGIGTITPNSKSLLDLTATDKGFLVPRLTTLERVAINPVGNADAALLVYDTDDNLFYFWNSTAWVPFPNAGSNNISLNYDANTGTLSLTDAGGTLTANFPPDNDPDPNNELITGVVFDANGNILTINEGGNTWSTAISIVDPDSDPTNEIQNLSLNNNILNLSISNNNVDLSPYLDNTDNQTLTLNGNNLSISNGNSVDLTQFAGDWKLLGNAGTNPATNFLGTTDNQDLVFRTNNAERLRILSNGNVGIGSSNPTFKLDVFDGGINLDNENFSVFWGTSFSNAVEPSGHFIGRRARGTRANPQYSLNGDILVAFQGRSFLMPVPGAWAGMVIRAAENHGPNNQGAEMEFSSVPVGTTSVAGRMWIKENGRVGIGTNVPDQLLSVNGNASKPGGGTWIALSDERTKKNIQVFNDGLNIINKLRPVSYQYNEVSGYQNSDETYVGFIAQEVEKIAPYMVSTIDDSKGISGITDKKVLDDSALTKILVNAVKELSEKVNRLEKQNETLIKLNAELEKMKSFLFQEASK